MGKNGILLLVSIVVTAGLWFMLNNQTSPVSIVDSGTANPKASFFAGAQVLRTVFALIFVSLLAAISLKLVAPYLNSKSKLNTAQSNAARKLKILERLEVDQDNELVLISVSGHELLVSRSKSGIQLLGLFDADGQFSTTLSDKDKQEYKQELSLVEALKK